MKFLLINLLCLLMLAGCSTALKNNKDCIAKPNPDCMCTQQYDPVCGCDGKTYGNACMAGCASIKIVSKGPCPTKKP